MCQPFYLCLKQVRNILGILGTFKLLEQASYIIPIEIIIDHVRGKVMFSQVCVCLSMGSFPTMMHWDGHAGGPSFWREGPSGKEGPPTSQEGPARKDWSERMPGQEKKRILGCGRYCLVISMGDCLVDCIITLFPCNKSGMCSCCTVSKCLNPA